MTLPRLGILGMGDMGAALARALVNNNVTVLTTLHGRSEETRQRANTTGAHVLPSLADLVAQCEIFLSVVPPASAKSLAGAISDLLKGRPSTADRMIYADCNAITPAHSRAIGSLMEAAGAAYIDGGIIGPPPGIGVPRLYLAGPEAERLSAFDGMGLSVRPLAGEVGDASALKLLFSGLNKGLNALSITMLTAAESLGLSDPLTAEINAMLPAIVKRMEAQLPYLPINAARWISEMHEVGDLLAENRLPDGFHRGAAEIFGILAATPFAAETRETFDSSRKPRDVARACVERTRR